MDYYDSKAAVDAMAALQIRIRELEKGNAALKKECAKLRAVADEDETTLNQREMQLLEASDKAQKMLAGASDTLVELRRIRKENRMLQQQLDNLQKELEDKVKEDKKTEESLNSIETKKNSAKKLIAEYEALFKEILSPPELKLNNNTYIPFNHTTISTVTHSLPATLQQVVQILQSLPFPFRDQKIEKKREIMSSLLYARDIAARLADEIHDLELQKKDSRVSKKIQSEINTKAAHYQLIRSAMSRFKFE